MSDTKSVSLIGLQDEIYDFQKIAIPNYSILCWMIAQISVIRKLSSIWFIMVINFVIAMAKVTKSAFTHFRAEGSIRPNSSRITA